MGDVAFYDSWRSGAPARGARVLRCDMTVPDPVPGYGGSDVYLPWRISHVPQYTCGSGAAVRHRMTRVDLTRRPVCRRDRLLVVAIFAPGARPVLMSPPATVQLSLAPTSRSAGRDCGVCPRVSPPARQRLSAPSPSLSPPPVPARLPTTRGSKVLPSAPGFGYNPHSR